MNTIMKKNIAEPNLLHLLKPVYLFLILLSQEVKTIPKKKKHMKLKENQLNSPLQLSLGYPFLTLLILEERMNLLRKKLLKLKFKETNPLLMLHNILKLIGPLLL